MIDEVGQSIAGTRPGIHLNQEGRAQAAQLAARLSSLRLDGIVSSPLERAQETAAALAENRRVTVETMPDFQEVAFGDWTGCGFAALESDARWRQFNTTRSIV